MNNICKNHGVAVLFTSGKRLTGRKSESAPKKPISKVNFTHKLAATMHTMMYTLSFRVRCYSACNGQRRANNDTSAEISLGLGLSTKVIICVYLLSVAASGEDHS